MSHAQTGDTLASGKPRMLYFRFDRSLVDSGYMDNRHTLHQLDQLLRDTRLTVRIDSLIVCSFSSPDGDEAYNRRLALQRAQAVKGYFVWKYPHLDQRRIRTRPQGENWSGLRQAIELDPSVPDREEVLQILDATTDIRQCKTLLRRLNGGIAYDYIEKNLLRYLRNASICTVYYRYLLPDSLPPLALRPQAPFVVPGRTADGQMADGQTSSSSEAPYGGSAYTQAPDRLSLFSNRVYRMRRPLFALKTNLLFDVAMMPNIEVEVPLGNRWSVSGELMFPWWLFEDDKYCLQVLSGGVEGRYWLGNRTRRRALTGHFAGLYAGGGKYDLQNDRNGYQGEFFIAAGISYGYALPIGRKLSLEFSIGIGLLRTGYEHYHAIDNHQTLLWQESGKYTWLGPTKAKISFVWLLDRLVKRQEKGGVR